MNNSAYLKDYVRMHPDNRMAWYLLGKEYEQNGQEGKANYCYIQAGDIYEAFESSKTPDEVWKEYAAELLEASKRKSRSRTRRRKGLAALMLLVLVLFSPLWSSAPAYPHAEHDNEKAQPAAAAEATAEEASSREKPAPKPPEGPYFTAAAAGTKEERKQALAALVANKDYGANEVALLGMKSRDGWLLWSRQMPLEFSVVQNNSKGQTSIQALNEVSCGCEPPDEPELKRKARSWTEEQELQALLSSAILQFQAAEGRFPQTPGELNRPYPNNWIAGDTPGLGKAFKAALVHVKRGQTTGGKNTAGQVASQEGAATAKPGEPFFQQPLEIKVDKEKHLLALVSGKVVLRVYKVGLGGDRTPEGTFRIAEKVVNPNGHDNGEFGSRGMALTGGNYAIHGTNEPDSIGLDESLGCIRMAKADVEELFDMVPKGIKVTIGKGILPVLQPGTSERFVFPDRQDQTNPHKTYHWLD